MAIARLSMKLGKRGKGGAHADYIMREGDYALQHEKYEKLEVVEAGNMPSFAVVDPRAFFEASDANERANAKYSYREMELSLPREMTPDQRADLMQDWCEQELASYPFLYAIHNPIAADGGEQPHAHLMFSERENDGIERDEEHFFKRANTKHPERGGARKTYNLEASKQERQNKLVALRGRWQEHVNEHLAKAELDARIDMRSYADQGIDKSPSIKMLPSQSAHRARLMKEAQQYQDQVTLHRDDVRQQATAYIKEKNAEIYAAKAAKAAKAAEAKTPKQAAQAPKEPQPKQSPALVRKTAEIAAQKRETASASGKALDAETQLLDTQLDLDSANRALKTAKGKFQTTAAAVTEAKGRLDGITGMFKGKDRKAATAALEQAQAQHDAAMPPMLDADAQRRALEHQHREQMKAAKAARAEADAQGKALAKLESQHAALERSERPEPQGDAWAQPKQSEAPQRDAWSQDEPRTRGTDGPELG